MSAAATKDQLHLLVLRQDEEILEQKYDLSGVLDRDSIKSVSHTSNDDTTVAQLLQYGVLIALIVVSLVVATGSGPVLIVPFKNVDFAVAPMSLRLAAALIDLFPLYIWRLIITWRYQRGLKQSSRRNFTPISRGGNLAKSQRPGRDQSADQAHRRRFNGGSGHA